MSTSTRSYRMKVRAAAAEEATERILDAAEQLFWEDPAQPVTLAAVATLAGVSVHSIIRRFGGQEGVMRAAAERATARTEAERAEPDPGNLDAVVAVLVGHYERAGDRVMRMLAAEYALPTIAELIDRGRTLHADWCARMFADALDTRTGAARKRLLAELVAICDVYTWFLLRRQRGLTRRETERALFEMLAPVVNGRSPS